MSHHYTQELVAAKVIIPVRVDTAENKSDLLTKALGPTVFPILASALVGPIAGTASPRVLMFRTSEEGNSRPCPNEIAPRVVRVLMSALSVIAWFLLAVQSLRLMILT